MKRLLLLSAVCGVLSSCVKPSVQDIFIKSADAAEGVYLFDFDLSDSLSVYDIYLYSRTDVAPRAFKRVPSINMTVEWFAPGADLTGECGWSAPDKVAGECGWSAPVPGADLTGDAAQTAARCAGVVQDDFPDGGGTELPDTMAPGTVSGASRSEVPELTDTVAMSAVQHGTVKQPYRTGVNPSVRGLWRLRVSVLNAPEHFCGLGIICERKDGTR